MPPIWSEERPPHRQNLRDLSGTTDGVYTKRLRDCQSVAAARPMDSLSESSAQNASGIPADRIENQAMVPLTHGPQTANWPADGRTVDSCRTGLEGDIHDRPLCLGKDIQVAIRAIDVPFAVAEQGKLW